MKSDQELAEALLSAESDDPVPPEHAARIAAGLASQLGAAPRADAGADANAHATAGGGASAGAAANGAVVGTAAATKLGTIVLVALGAGGAGFALGRATAPHPTPMAAPLATVPPSASFAAPLASAEPPLPSAVPTAVPSAVSSSAADASTTAPPVTKPQHGTEGAPAFDREQSLLERARSALSRRDGVAAQEALDTATREFPKSRHAEERAYLNILALQTRGDTERAREAAKVFLTRYPDSLMKTRVETIAK